MADAQIVHRRIHGSVNRIAWSTGDVARIMARFGATGLEIPPAGKSPMMCEAPGIISASKVDGTSRTFTLQFPRKPSIVLETS